jgi:hypothetical protein
MNTEHTPAVTPDQIRARLRCAADALQEAESVALAAAKEQPSRFGALVAGLAITRAELKFAAKRWRSGSAV